MNSFFDAHVRSLIESIRVLERHITEPSQLQSDLRMLRESLDLFETQEPNQDDWLAKRLTSNKQNVGQQATNMEIIRLTRTAVSLLNKLRDGEGIPFSRKWAEKANRVLEHVWNKQVTELRHKTASRVRGLYVIVDPEVTRRRPVIEVAQAAIAGGATVIQLRNKRKDSGEILQLTRELRSTCNQSGTLFIINDDAALTVASSADGLHLGQSDLPVQEAQLIIHPEQIVGRSNNNIREVLESEAAGVDYLAIGAIFPTATMGKTGRDSVGVETITIIKNMVDKPVVAIGGINEINVTEVIAAGADAVCVVSAITLAKD
ncbi:MAG: thiamine phosphate synthase, partial [SAR202 cluster bacterium]|nr:thiamine phosphate synthase [SAR202 cluster bacterium]